MPALPTTGAGYTLDYVGSDYGLPQSSVRAIGQSHSGFLWVGTESGLHRFDGSQFELFESPFGHGVVNSITIDRRGRVWTSWLSKPATMYDPATRQWTILDVQPPRILPLGFLEDPSGRIWLSDGSALYAYNEVSKVPIVQFEFDFEADTIISGNLIWDSRIIWLPVSNAILGYNTETNEVSRTSLPNAGPAVTVLRSEGTVWSCHRNQVFRKSPGERFEIIYENDDVQVTTCARDAAGRLWLGTSNAGAVLVESAQDFQHFDHDKSDPSSIPFSHVVKIFIDQADRVWLVSPNQVSLYDGGHFFNYNYNSGGLGSDFTTLFEPQIVEDRSGVIWLGTASSGLARLSRYSRRFESAIPPVDDKRPGKLVFDDSGNLWVGMKNGGVHRWNREDNSWVQYLVDIDDATKLPTAEVRALLLTATGEIYAGSKIGILSRYNTNIDGWSRIHIGGTEPIYNLLELKDHRVVIGRDRFLSVYDPDTSLTTNYPLDVNARIGATTLSSSGRVWVGTHEGPGLLEFYPDEGFGSSWPDLFGEMKVISLHEDKNGVVWIGTWGDGLIRFNPQTRRVQQISADSGLTGHTFTGILPGARDEIWTSSEEGLFRIRNCLSQAHKCEPHVTKYNVTDGLENRWYAPDSYFLSSSGELFFGGSAGIDFFHPSLFEENRTPPIMNLIAVSLNGVDMTASINSGDHVSLPHEFGELEIRFAATDFHDAEKNRYRYRMNKRGPWVPLDNSNRMTLRNLQAGTHRLEITGSNNDGIWSTTPIVLTIAVAAPAFFSWWALTLYCLLVATLIYTISRFRERRNRAYTIQLEQQVEERTSNLRRANNALSEFYANVSHEVRTPLALIFSAVDRLPDSIGSADSRDVVASIRRHTRSLSRYVDGLITVSQLQSSSEPVWGAVNATEYLEQLVKDLQPLAGNRRLLLKTSSNDQILVRTQPNALNTIFSNLIVNAIKHAKKAGTIQVTAKTDPLFAQFTIEDDGPGVDPDIREKIFDRGALYSTMSGYGIGLHLVRQATIALGGDVVADESELGGARFRVSIPLADQSVPIIESLSADTPLEIDNRDSETQGNPSMNNGVGPSILIVEDNDELRRNVRQYLFANYNILEASTVNGALRVAVDEVPDAVLCDILLPDGSGFDVVQQIKEDLITEHIPVIIMTALADESSRMKGLKLRADAYLTKPFQRDVLETTLDNLIRDRRNVLRHAALRVWNETRVGPLVVRGSESDFTRRFMAALEECYSDPASDIGVIAERLAMSRRGLERKTGQFLGRSPHELLVEFRLQNATYLLEKGARVSAVSVACGFRNPSTFGTAFKKHFGCSPSEYAKRNSNAE